MVVEKLETGEVEEVVLGIPEVGMPLKSIIQQLLSLDDYETDAFAAFCVGEGFRSMKPVEWPKRWSKLHPTCLLLEREHNIFDSLTYMHSEWIAHKKALKEAIVSSSDQPLSYLKELHDLPQVPL